MSAVGELRELKERPAQIEFERRAVEDQVASRQEGRYVTKDVDFVTVFIPYSRDTNVFKVDQWLRNLEQYTRDGRIPPDWLPNYKRLYEAWKNGQELPPNGTPIKGWGVISPAQQQNLIHYRVLTVEDAAGMNEDILRKIGMGGVEIKNKAKAWLAQITERGPMTMQIAELQRENELLKGSIASLEAKIDRMAAERHDEVEVEVSRGTIDSSDIIPDLEPTPEPPPKVEKRKPAATI
jgi:hypothetical protein